MKRLLITAAGLAMVVAVLLAIAAWRANHYLDSPLPVPEQGLTFEIAPGTSFSAVSAKLAEQGLVTRPRVFRGYARPSLRREWRGSLVRRQSAILTPWSTSFYAMPAITEVAMFSYSIRLMRP